MNEPVRVIECGVHTGILFSRKRCAKPAAVHCGRCKVAMCKEHLVPQGRGPFLCPRCDRYVNDDDHDWDYNDRSGWRWRGSRSSRDDDRPAQAAATGAAVAQKQDAPPGLDDRDKEGFDLDDKGGGDAVLDADADIREGDFDAS